MLLPEIVHFDGSPGCYDLDMLEHALGKRGPNPIGYHFGSTRTPATSQHLTVASCLIHLLQCSMVPALINAHN